MAAAEQWMTKTEQRSHLMSQASLAAMKLFVRAIVDCRAGRADDAVLYLDERWAEHEAMLSGDTLRPLRIVRAFAIAACGPRNSVSPTPWSASRVPPIRANTDHPDHLRRTRVRGSRHPTTLCRTHGPAECRIIMAISNHSVF
jgi:hypothetical protein